VAPLTPFRSRRSLLAVLAATLAAGCVPTTSAIVVTPTAAMSDSADDAIAIVARVAAVRGLYPYASRDAGDLAWRGCHVRGSLTLCAKQFDAETHVLLTEQAVFSRSAPPLKAMLLDTLGAHFGLAQVRECVWKDARDASLSGCATAVHEQFVQARVDSLRQLRDTAHYRPVDCGACFFALVGMFSAPAGIAALDDDTTTAPIARPASRFTLRIAGGLDQSKDTLVASTYSFNAEYLGARMLAEVRQQEVDVPGAVLLRSAHVGRTFGGATHVGAITVGYRWISGSAATSGRIAGPEVGFPLLIIRPHSEWRMDASYVFSLHGTNWNYRVQWEHESTRHLLLGWKVETTSVPLREDNNIAWVAASAIIGLRR